MGGPGRRASFAIHQRENHSPEGLGPGVGDSWTQMPTLDANSQAHSMQVAMQYTLGGAEAQLLLGRQVLELKPGTRGGCPRLSVGVCLVLASSRGGHGGRETGEFSVWTVVCERFSYIILDLLFHPLHFSLKGLFNLHLKGISTFFGSF